MYWITRGLIRGIKMKKLYKGFLFTLSLSLFAANLLTAAESTISLPDVKTVVTGDNPEQKAVGPDFSENVSTPSPDGTLVPDVPESRKINLMGNLIFRAISDSVMIFISNIKYNLENSRRKSKSIVFTHIFALLCFLLFECSKILFYHF